MSTRYGISVTLDPTSTAMLHRARQVICSQYGCWASEMHSVHLPLTGYFPCPEEALPQLDQGLEEAGREFLRAFRQASIPILLARRQMVVIEEEPGNVYLEFNAHFDDPRLRRLSRLIDAGLQGAGLAGSEILESPGPLYFFLLQYAELRPPVFRSAARFAQGVVDGLDLAAFAGVSDLVLYRYQSEAAGEDWSGGRWAADLSWQILASHHLSTGEFL